MSQTTTLKVKKEKSAVLVILGKIYVTIKLRYKRQFALLLGIVILVIILSVWTTIPPYDQPYTKIWENYPYKLATYWPMSWQFPLGTTNSGENYFVMVLWATKNSINFGVLTATLATSIAILFGVFGPFKGGVADTSTSFVTNVAMVFPQIPFILFINTLMDSPSWITVMLVIGLFTWPWAARSIRAQVLTLKERNFIKVSKMSALGDMRIAFSEVIPNVLSYILLVFCICFGIAIITEAGISMLGLGPQNYLTLGHLLYLSLEKAWISTFHYNLWLTPGIVLTVVYLIFYSIQASFINTFNPRTRENI